LQEPPAGPRTQTVRRDDLDWVVFAFADKGHAESSGSRFDGEMFDPRRRRSGRDGTEVSTAQRRIRFGYLLIAGLAMSFGSVSANAASANDVLASCKLYLSVVGRHGAAREAEVARPNGRW
jgi:hypothetical protein